MDFLVGNFVKSTGAAPTATNTITPGFTPTAVIFWYSKEGSYGSIDAHAIVGWGFSDGTNSRACCTAAEDAGTQQDRYQASKGVALIDVGGGVIAECDVTFSATQVTCTWTTNDANAWLINYAVFGGVSAKVGDFTARTSTGSQARTGIGFRPDMLFTLNDTDGSALPASQIHAISSFGFAANNAAGGIMQASEDATIDTEGHISTSGLTALTIKSGTISLDAQASISSWDADGWTESWTVLAAGGWRYGYLAIGGVTAFVDNGTSPSATGTQARTGYGFTPKGVFAVMIGTTAGSQQDIELCIGAASSTSARRVLAWHDRDAADESDMRLGSGAVLSVLDTTPAQEEAADLSSFDADGLTWNWAAVVAAAQRWRCIAFADRPVTKGIQLNQAVKRGSEW